MTPWANRLATVLRWPMGGLFLLLVLLATWGPVTNNRWSLFFYRRHGPELAAGLPLQPMETGDPLPPATQINGARWLVETGFAPPSLTAALGLAAEQGDLLAAHTLGLYLARQGDTSGALASWRRAGDLKSVLRLAANAESQTAWADAELAFQMAWEMDRERGAMSLVRFYGRREELSGALAILETMIGELPSSPLRPAWIGEMGRLLRLPSTANTEDRVLARLIGHFPADPLLLMERAQVRYARGEGIMAALADLQQAAALTPQDYRIPVAMAGLLMQDGQPAQAEDYFTAAIELAPERANLYRARANGVRDQGEVGRALVYYLAALQRFPQDLLLTYELAWAYHLAGDEAQAAAAIRRAMELSPAPNQSFLLRAALIDEAAGNVVDARHWYEQLLLLQPDNQTALNGLARLP